MKILHTSDWHLGRSLYGRKRYTEFSQFLDWLIATIEQEQVDILLVAGDIFDTSTPSNYAQELYYRFLHQVSVTHCQHIVIIAGNHDSPSFLNAPKALLRALNVYVVGAAMDDPRDEVLVLKDRQDQPQAIICAVPYLREKDIRKVESGESIEDKGIKLIEGLKLHYAQVCDYAEQQQQVFQKQGMGRIPLIAMGHLFTAGGKTTDGDGVRELYVGSLAFMGQDVFPESIDYLALGHLHIPQWVASNERFRYSGAPLPMTFGELEQHKLVLLINFDGSKEPGKVEIKEIPVPSFQSLKQLRGSLEKIQEQLELLKKDDSAAWLEIIYEGKDVIADLWGLIEESIAGTRMEVLRIKNQLAINFNSMDGTEETLDDMDEYDVFEQCLQAYDIPEENRSELLLCYKEILQSLYEDDPNAI